MVATETTGLVTIHDILHEVDVTDRTIRSWVARGLLAQPVKRGLGRARGTIAFYPGDTVEKAKAIHAIRKAGRTEELLEVVGKVGKSEVILRKRGEEVTIIYRPPMFKESRDELETV